MDIGLVNNWFHDFPPFFFLLAPCTYCGVPLQLGKHHGHMNIIRQVMLTTKFRVSCTLHLE